MNDISLFVNALSAAAWPAIAFYFLYYFRKNLNTLIISLKDQVTSGAAIKWKDFEFKGIDISSSQKIINDLFKRELADKDLLDKRHAAYAKNKNLFLVHRVRKTGEIHPIVKLPTFDISIYIVAHKSYGKMNDVKEVEYYFGHHFGLSQGKYGTKYVISNGSENFAVKINAYGPTLCEARIQFHDGSETTVNRYLDFEGTGYQFNVLTNHLDAEKMKLNGEN